MEEKELTKADLLGMKNPPPKKVTVAGVGTVYVRIMNPDEKDAYEISAYNKNKPAFRSGLLARTLCDKDGNRMFSDDPAELVAVGSIISPILVERAFNAARKINAFSEKDIQELEKNSDGDLQDA
jgi:hypothetical protein